MHIFIFANLNTISYIFFIVLGKITPTQSVHVHNHPHP